MKKLLFLFTSLMLLVGCSSKEEEPTKDNSSNKDEIVLEVIKTYSNDYGDYEAYYIKDVEESHTEKDITLTIKTVEYGKAELDEANKGNYQAYTDADGKVTYVKLNMEITGDSKQIEQHIFYPYQGDIILKNGDSYYSDSSISDLVSTGGGQGETMSGEVYFFIKAEMPITEFTFKASAPFDKDTKDSISEPYEINIKLTK